MLRLAEHLAIELHRHPPPDPEVGHERGDRQPLGDVPDALR
jgi:hypothetical protein